MRSLSADRGERQVAPPNTNPFSHRHRLLKQSVNNELEQTNGGQPSAFETKRINKTLKLNKRMAGILGPEERLPSGCKAAGK